MQGKRHSSAQSGGAGRLHTVDMRLDVGLAAGGDRFTMRPTNERKKP
jgi:hypothetical protein